ncbi:MAG: TspO/MBR family protein [Fibrobacteria bacterium]
MTFAHLHPGTLALCVGIPVLAGAVSGFASMKDFNSWYATLRKPSFNPPNAIFGPVWTGLYLLMGISLYLVWKAAPSPDRSAALVAFGAQLVLNFAWSFLFFRFHRIALAFREIILLYLCIIWMMVLFARVDATAAWLQVPYLLWTGFATVLNKAFRSLNPGY